MQKTRQASQEPGAVGGRAAAAALLLLAGVPAAQGLAGVPAGPAQEVRCRLLVASPAPGEVWRIEVDARGLVGAAWTLVEVGLGAGPARIASLQVPEDGVALHELRLPEDPELAGRTLSVRALVGGSSAGGASSVCGPEELVVAQLADARADFTAYPTLGVGPLTVAFEDLSSGHSLGRLWDFGDGATSTRRAPRHTYAAPGTYDVTLTFLGPGRERTRTRPAFVNVFDPATQPYDGFTLEITNLPTGNPSDNARLEVLDMDLQVVHSYQDPLPGWAFAELAKPLSNGRVLGLIYERGSPAGTIQKQIVELGPTGNLLWSYDPRPRRLTADFERLGNGNTLVLLQYPESWPAIHNDPIFNEYLTEVDAAGNIVWEYSLAEHWDDLPLTPAERNYLMNFPGNPGGVRWIFHTNSVATLPPNPWEATDPRFARGNVMISLREASKILVIDRTTDEVVWSRGGTVGQHHARMIPPGLPGAGNVLLFDNGGTAGAPPITRTYSRVLEIDPTTSRVVWSYQDPGNFYSPRMSSAQRLPNGNTLVTEGTPGVLSEIDPAGQVLWTHVRSSATPRIFRAYRVELGWPNGPISFPW